MTVWAPINNTESNVWAVVGALPIIKWQNNSAQIVQWVNNSSAVVAWQDSVTAGFPTQANNSQTTTWVQIQN